MFFQVTFAQLLRTRAFDPGSILSGSAPHRRCQDSRVSQGEATGGLERFRRSWMTLPGQGNAIVPFDTPSKAPLTAGILAEVSPYERLKARDVLSTMLFFFSSRAALDVATERESAPPASSSGLLRWAFLSSDLLLPRSRRSELACFCLQGSQPTCLKRPSGEVDSTGSPFSSCHSSLPGDSDAPMQKTCVSAPTFGS